MFVLTHFILLMQAYHIIEQTGIALLMIFRSLLDNASVHPLTRHVLLIGPCPPVAQAQSPRSSLSRHDDPAFLSYSISPFASFYTVLL